MTETIGHILNAVGRHAPWLRAAAWDPVGLQLGDPARPAHRIAVCHEVTESLVTQLSGFDLVISYHPLLFRPLRRLVAGTAPGGRALRLIEAGTAVAAIHTNFDAAPGGTADALAAELGLADCRSFGPIEGEDTVKVAVFVPAADADRLAAAMAAAGAGHIGNYSGCSFRLGGTGTFVAEDGARPAIGSVGRTEHVAEMRLEMIAPKAREADVIAALVSAHPYEEPAFDVYDVRANLGLIGRVGTVERQPIRAFAAMVQAQLGGAQRVAGNGEVERVAVVPGSGADFIEPALAAGADTLVTGDVNHHRARAALDADLRIIDAGHVPSERPGVRALYAAVSDLTTNVEMVDAPDTDPWERS